jgi:hypothetical protein
MNCKRSQEEIAGALASGESGFGRKLGQHLQDCAACRKFLADQAAFFQSLDSHLRVIANEPVPPSLLPGVRVRLQQEVLPRQGTRTWQLAAIGALVVLSAAVSMPLRRSVTPAHTTGSAAAVAYDENSAKHSRPALGGVPLPAPQPIPSQVTRKASVASISSATEVLVLREEQEAYVHFVNELSKDRDAARPLAFAAPASDGVPVEIALLVIESVEVKPLEGTGSE